MIIQIFKMEVITSTKGKKQLVYEGYVFVFQKKLASGTDSYECQRRRNYGCNARIKVLDDTIVDAINDHVHAPAMNHVEALRLRHGIKRKAIESQETPQQIISSAMVDISDGAASIIPPMRTIRRCIRRYRQSVGIPHPIPLGSSEMDIPEGLKLTTHGEQFLLFDSGKGSSSRMLIYSTQTNLDLLHRSELWFADGTFKTVPEIFYQLYTIHAFSNGRVFPCVYALLSDKKEETYNSFFLQLNSLKTGLNPVHFSVDFEQAAINAIRVSFPLTKINGCFFHFSQNVYRKIQSQGLQHQYMADYTFSQNVKMLVALAFMPLGDVINAFETLVAEMPEQLDPIIDYFENNYIGVVHRRGRRPPRFPLQLWNVKDRIEEEIPRTNNHVEAYHRHLQAAILAFHPNIWTFLQVLKKEEALRRVEMIQMEAGEVPPPQKLRYRECNIRIKTIVKDYTNRNILSYLRGIAHNLSF